MTVPEHLGEATVELRCPLPPRKLFAKMVQRGEQPEFLEESNWIVFSCYDCRRVLRAEGDFAVKHVYHSFSILGELMNTEVER